MIFENFNVCHFKVMVHYILLHMFVCHVHAITWEPLNKSFSKFSMLLLFQMTFGSNLSLPFWSMFIDWLIYILVGYLNAITLNQSTLIIEHWFFWQKLTSFQCEDFSNLQIQQLWSLKMLLHVYLSDNLKSCPIVFFFKF